MITTQKELRTAFWSECRTTNPEFIYRPGIAQNFYPPEVRMAWCDFVDRMARDGAISEALAERATL